MISKRLRYEILRRDNHTCRYCGGVAPDVKLTVDHVVPTALGGTDVPTNLVAACADCNAGKTSSAPDGPLVDDVAKDALRWSAAMLQAADSMAAARTAQDARAFEFLTVWKCYYITFRGGPRHLPGTWPQTLDQFFAAGLPDHMIHEAVHITAARQPEEPWRYFCGVAWRMVTELQERARTLLLTEKEAPDGP